MIAAGAAVVLLASCGKSGPRGQGSGSAGADSAGPVREAGPGGPKTPLIVFMGTSLTAGLGLDPSEAFPALIQNRLDSLQLLWHTLNAGVSGETSAGALRRIEWVLEDRPEIVVLETGANDGLRGLDPDSTRANLEAIVRRARELDPGVEIVLAGMEAPPNLGARYTSRFRAIYREVAEREHLRLIPFLLQGVGGVESLNQSDGIHPNAAGERIVAENVWRVLEPLVRSGAGATPRAPQPAPVSR